MVVNDIREQIKELRRNQGYGGSEVAADTMEKLLERNLLLEAVTDALTAERAMLGKGEQNYLPYFHRTNTALAAVQTGPGLPGTENCSNDWHRLKFVSTDQCPDCEMTVEEVNVELRKQEKDDAVT